VINWRRGGSLAWFLLLMAAWQSHGAEQAPAGRPGVASPTVVTLTLEEAIGLAGKHQPGLAAHRASLAAAEDGLRALEALRAPKILAPELPTRRLQASLGVTAASAGLLQAERETVYAVTRTYFTAIYAREQERVAKGIVDRMGATHKVAAQMLKDGARDVTTADVDRIAIYMDLAEVRRIQAEKGIERALTALREAIGLSCDYTVQVPPGGLPEPEARPCRQEVVALALARQGDLIRARVFVDSTCLEVEAQQTSVGHRMETFAVGADIHSSQVPQGMHNGEYRPGAIGPEMPSLLVGAQAERVRHAHTLNLRAGAVSEKSRNLIALEAEDAFLRWEEASLKVARARKAAETGDRLAEGLGKDLGSGQKVKVEDVLSSHVLAAQARSQLNEFLWQEILALADMERITAGGFCAGLTGPGLPMPKPVEKQPVENDGR